MDVGDGRIDLLLHFLPVTGFQFSDGLSHLVQGIVAVASLVSLVSLRQVFFGRLQQRHGVTGFLGGLKVINRFALIGQVRKGLGGGDTQNERRA